MNVDSIIIPGGCTKYIQAPDVCWNKSFKARMRPNSMINGSVKVSINLLNVEGNMKPPSKKKVIEWVIGTWSQLSKENITKSF